MTEFFDRIMQHIHRLKPTPALEWPSPLLIRLDQRHENVELVAFWRSNGRAPKLLNLGECGAVVFISADRADLHGGPRQNFATVRASMTSMGTIASAVDISFPPYRDIPFALR